MAHKLLSEKQLSTFCGSLAMMLRSGVALTDAVALFSGEDASFYSDGDSALPTGLQRVSERLGEALERGESFASAAEETGVFPEYAIGVLRAAEVSGRLDEALERLARYFESQNRLFDRLRSAVVYPVLLMLLMCIVLSVLVFGILPVFMRVYDSLTGSISASTYAYIPAANVIGVVSLVLALVVGVALLILALVIRSPEGRGKLRGKLERSRLTRRAFRLLAVSEMMDTVSTLLASGSDETAALDFYLRQGTGGTLDMIMRECRADMDGGTTFCRALLRRQVLPAVHAQMLLTGEESGTLPRSMELVSRHLAQEAEDALCGVIDGIEPVLIAFLTVSVGFTLLSVMLPLLGIVYGL